MNRLLIKNINIINEGIKTSGDIYIEGEFIKKIGVDLKFDNEIKIIDGKLKEDELIYYNDIEIGKILINEDYPFALVKYLNQNFNKDLIFKSKKGSFKILIPERLKI